MRNTDLSKYNNKWYASHIGAGRFKQVIWYFVNIIFFVNPLNPVSGIKVFLLRIFGADLGKGVVIKPGVSIKYPWKLTVGHHTWIGEKVWIDNLAHISLGNNVCISQGAMLLTGNHDFSKITFDLMVKPIVIEDGAWVGAKAIVCPGVTVGQHAVLTVKSVATRSMNPFGIYQGNPAVFIKKRLIS